MHRYKQVGIFSFINGNNNGIYYIYYCKGDDNMNEILLRKTVKKVMLYGVSKQTARDVAEVVVHMSESNIDFYIKYSLDLLMGYGLTQRKVK